MRFLLFLISLCVSNICFDQVVFLETFDEVDNSTTGTDNTVGAVAWTALCPGSVAATDYFQVLSGKLEARDTNTPAATWETDDIDISSCLLGLNISFDIEQVDDMEECADCPGVSGASCIDWVKLEYNLDGAGWTEVAGTTCGLTEAPGELIQIGDLALGGPITYTSPCIDIGTTLAIRISCLCWSANERWLFDNISVECTDCLLPIDLIDYSAKPSKDGINLSWTTVSERSNDYFTLERSNNGIDFEEIAVIKGAGNSSERIEYSYEDINVKEVGTNYYRLKQFDFDGNNAVSKSISINYSPDAVIKYMDGKILYYLQNYTSDMALTINVYNLNGQLIHQETTGNKGAIDWNQKGFYIIEIPELNIKQKLVISE